MTTPTCVGTTRKGEPCTKAARDGGYCHQHQGQAPVPEPVVVHKAAQRSQEPPGARIGPSGSAVRRQARQRRPRARAAASYAFSRPRSLAHAPKAPRVMDMAVRESLRKYRTWTAHRAH